MKTTFKLFLMFAMAFSTAAMIGCTGPNAVDEKGDKEGEVSGMSEEEYEKQMQQHQQQGAAQGQQGGGAGAYPN